MQIDVGSCVWELRNSLSRAVANYEIWRVYKEERSLYVQTMNQYRGFFTLSISAHFVAMVVILYWMYERPNKKKDNFSIPGLLEELRNDQGVDIAAVEEIHKRAKPLWVKVCRLRNNVFGHRSMARPPQQTFEEVGVTMDEFKQLLEITDELLNHVSPTGQTVDLGAREDAIRVLEALKG